MKTLHGIALFAAFLLCIAGFAACLEIHALTYLSARPRSAYPSFFTLHVGGMLVCFFTALLFNRKGKSRETDAGRSAVSPPAQALGVALALYAAGVFYFSLIVYNKMGTPYQEGASYALRAHGNLIEMLSRDEYLRHVAHQYRAMTAFWMAVLYGFGAEACSAGMGRMSKGRLALRRSEA